MCPVLLLYQVLYISLDNYAMMSSFVTLQHTSYCKLYCSTVST